MPTLYLTKTNQGFIPVDDLSVEIAEEIPYNTEYKAVLSRPRNYKFHQKFFVLLDVAFNLWDVEDIEFQSYIVKKNKEYFRKQIIIKCGYFTVNIDLNKRVRLEAKSISFANMEEDDFAKLYDTAINVILSDVLTNYTKEDLNEQVNRILRF